MGGGVIVAVYYKDDILKFFKIGDGGGNGTCNLQCTAPQVLDTASCTCKTPTDGGSGGGGGNTTGQWYRANGPTVTIPAGRKDFTSNRWSKNVTGWSNGFEVMGYVTAVKMSSGSHIGLKMGGPNHGSGCGYKSGGPCGGGSDCCCWWDGGLRRNGKSYLEIEAPHPHNCRTKYFESMGRNIDDGLLGVRWLNAKEGNGRRNMFWIDKSDRLNSHNWQLMYNVLDTGQFMPTSYYNKIPNELELEIRISDVDNKNIHWHTGPFARKIEGVSTFSPTSTFYDPFGFLRHDQYFN